MRELIEIMGDTLTSIDLDFINIGSIIDQLRKSCFRVVIEPLILRLSADSWKSRHGSRRVRPLLCQVLRWDGCGRWWNHNPGLGETLQNRMKWRRGLWVKWCYYSSIAFTIPPNNPSPSTYHP